MKTLRTKSVVELLEQAIRLAWKHGYNVRQEHLDGTGGGCEFGGKKWIFVDLSLPHLDQLDQVRTALVEDSDFDNTALPIVLRPQTTAIEIPKAA